MGRGRVTVLASPFGVVNNTWRELPLKSASHCGEIQETRELAVDRSERGAAGYLPEGVSAAALGSNSENTIAGGEIRIFRVRVAEEGVTEIPHLKPPRRPAEVVLNLRDVASIEEEILRRPTFFQHFDGVMADWRCLRRTTPEALRRKARWTRQQGLKVTVDLWSGINLFPDLRLIDNDEAEYREARVLEGAQGDNKE